MGRELHIFISYMVDILGMHMCAAEQKSGTSHI